MNEHDWSAFACPNPDCPTYGHKGQGNLRPQGRYGKQQGIRCLRCTTCVIFQRRLQQIVLIFLNFGCHTPVQFWPQSVAVARILSK